MSDQSFDAIVPVVRRYAAARLACPDLQAVALVLAWYYWSIASAKRHLPASVWARLGVRHALAGRDLPGVQSSKTRDCWDHLEAWQGAGMQDVMERRPGPAHVAVVREEVQRFFAGLDDFEQRMCEMLADGVPNNEMARRLSRTPGAISQRRRRLMERYRNS